MTEAGGVIKTNLQRERGGPDRRINPDYFLCFAFLGFLQSRCKYFLRRLLQQKSPT